MGRRLSMGLHGCAVHGGAGTALVARFISSAPAIVIALVIAMAAVGGAFIGRQGSPWSPTWRTIADNATSRPSADRVDPRENDPARGDRANDDGYLDGLARAMGYDSVEQMVRADRPQAPSNVVHR